MIDTINFAEPQFLWLLIAPAVLLVLWAWRLVRHAHDRRAFRRHRRLPVRERLTLFGGLLFWLCLTGALALTIAAMARPTAVVPLPRMAGADVIVLQDGSASMRVRDVGGDRWQRSVQFLRTLGESLRWKDDRWVDRGIVSEGAKAEAYARATIFAMPSVHETFGHTYL